MELLKVNSKDTRTKSIDASAVSLALIGLRSSHLSCSIEKTVLKNFAIFTGKHLCWSLFLIKLQDFRPATLLERDSNTDVFPWILQSFYEYLFWKTSTNGCFSKLQTFLQSSRKPNWNVVWIKINIYCLLWTDFRTDFRTRPSALLLNLNR